MLQEGTAKYATVDARSSRKSLKKRESWIREVIQFKRFVLMLKNIEGKNCNKEPRYVI